MIGWIVLWALLALLALLIAVVVIRGLLFTPSAETRPEPTPTAVDPDAATDHLAQMVRVPTVSYKQEGLTDQSAFDDFQALLEELYPEVHAHMTRENLGRNGLLYRWPGKNPGAPTVLMAHYDVVPADAEAWTKPPFCGQVEDGVLWGRGTLDTKGSLCGIFEGAEARLKAGFTPERDLYISLGGDEEIAGGDAPAIVAYLKGQGIRPELVVDEGGAVVEGVFPGVSAPCALIGVGEKGMADIRFTARSQGGHASTPPKHSPLGVLAQAIVNVENHPMKASFPPPTLEMFDILGRRAPLVYRILFGNQWLFGGLLKKVFGAMGGELNAMCRTTCAFTQAAGSPASNVLPPKVEAVANFRLSRSDTLESLKAHVQRAAGEGVEVEILHGSNASPYADTGSAAYRKVKGVIEETFPEAIVSPYVMLACSDSRHFCAICDNVLRFSPFEMSKQDRAAIHANDERIAVEKIGKCAQFYERLIGRC